MMKKRLSLIFAILMIFALLTGCGAKSDSALNESMDMESSTGNSNIGGAEPGIQYTDDYADLKGEVDEMVPGDSVSTTSEPADYSEKLIYTVYLSIETTDYETSVDTIAKLTEEFDGYVESANVESNRLDSSSRRYAYYTLRIPADKLEEFESSCGDVGNIYNSNRETQNATTAYIDLATRLEVYQTEEETLLGLLEEADSLETVIALNQRLSEVRYEIESIESSMRGIDALVAYSTVHIELQEVTRTTAVTEQDTFGQRVSARMNRTLTNFKNEMESIGIYLFGEFPLDALLFIIRLIPWLIVIAIVLLIVRKIRRRRIEKRGGQVMTRKERKLKKAENAPEAETPNEEENRE